MAMESQSPTAEDWSTIWTSNDSWSWTKNKSMTWWNTKVIRRLHGDCRPGWLQSIGAWKPIRFRFKKRKLNIMLVRQIHGTLDNCALTKKIVGTQVSFCSPGQLLISETLVSSHHSPWLSSVHWTKTACYIEDRKTKKNPKLYYKHNTGHALIVHCANDLLTVAPRHDNIIRISL
jgi:hypothetical protein